MSGNKSVDKREKSMAEFVVVIIIIVVLMKVFINYFIEQEQHITTTGFTAIAQNFNNTVMVVHAQWFMEQKPNIVWLATPNNKDKMKVTVNTDGWLDIPKETISEAIQLTNITPCEKIWQLALAIPMQLMKLSISTIELRDKAIEDFHHCRYLLPSGQYFEYHSKTGQVTKVIYQEKSS